MTWNRKYDDFSDKVQPLEVLAHWLRIKAVSGLETVYSDLYGTLRAQGMEKPAIGEPSSRIESEGKDGNQLAKRRNSSLLSGTMSFMPKLSTML